MERRKQHGRTDHSAHSHPHVMTHVWVTKRDGKITATSLEYQQRKKTIRATYSLMPGSHTFLVYFPLSRPSFPPGGLHLIWIAGSRVTSSTLLGKRKPFKSCRNTKLRTLSERRLLIYKHVWSLEPFCATDLLTFNIWYQLDSYRTQSAGKTQDKGWKSTPCTPMFATLDFYCTTSQREVLYILLHYIYLTAVVIGH